VRILPRYVLLRFLSWFVVVLIVLAAGLTIAEMLLHLDDVTQDSEGIFGALQFLALRVCSYYLPILIPIASFTAAYLALGTSARWLEITAAKAGGISPIRLTLPMLAAAAVLSVITLLVNETVVLEADRAWRRHLDGGESEENIEFRRGSFWYATGDYIYNVGDADPETQTLHELRIFQTDPGGRLIRRIEATSARVTDGQLELFDATELLFAPDRPRDPPQRSWKPAIMVDTDQTSRQPLLNADPMTLSMLSLNEFIGARKSQGHEVQRFVSLLHTRLTDPWSVFLLALLAIPFGLRVEQTKSLAIPALQGVGLLLIFWTFRGGATLLGAAAAPWLVLFAFLGFGVWRYARVPS
jgi:lipopolysaccharide export system permease protein